MAAAGFLLLSLPLLAQAREIGGIEFSGSGFMTLAIGKVMGGTNKRYNGYDCPCFISDYAQNAVYEDGGFDWKPDSKLGLQGQAAFSPQFSITGQVVFRGAKDGQPNLEWLYGDWKLNDEFNLQFGRKRIPQFYYSDTQDIGFALPWTHLPPQLYGWEAVNYNGVNLAYRSIWGGWAAAVNLLAGQEHRKDTGYWRIYYDKDSRTDIKWNNLVGGDLTLSRGWLETRLVYLQSDRQTKKIEGPWGPNVSNPTPDAGYSPARKQKIYGAAINIDHQSWFVRSEFIHIDHPGETFKDYAQIVGVGYRFGKWQPMLTWSNYYATAVEKNGGRADFDEEAHRNLALSLRYDLDTSSALKVQFDYQKDRSEAGSTYQYGDVRLLSFAYDKVF